MTQCSSLRLGGTVAALICSGVCAAEEPQLVTASLLPALPPCKGAPVACSGDLFVAWTHFSSQGLEVPVERPRWVNLTMCVLQQFPEHPCSVEDEFHILLSVLQGAGVDESIPARNFSCFLK